MNGTRAHGKGPACGPRMQALGGVLLAAAVLCGWAVMGPRSVWAQTPQSAALTDTVRLEQMLAWAEADNAGLRAARSQMSAARAAADRAGALPDPELSYSYNIERIETRVGPQRQAVGISQAIPWFGSLGAQSDQARAAADEAAARREEWVLDLRARVTTAYYELVYVDRARQIAEEEVELLDRLASVVTARYRAGGEQQTALLRIQIEIEKTRDRIAGLSDRRREIVARLNGLLGRPATAPLGRPERPAPPGEPSEVSALEPMLAEGNPRLEAARMRLAAEEAGVRLASKESYPDLMLGLRFIDTGEAVDPRMEDSGKDPWIATVGVRVPIWFGKQAAGRQAARQKREARRHELDDLRLTLMAELEGAASAWRDARRRDALHAETLVPLAEQALEVTLRAFSVGEAQFADVIDAQQTLLALRLDQERARTDEGRAVARVEQLIGSSLHAADTEQP